MGYQERNPRRPSIVDKIGNAFRNLTPKRQQLAAPGVGNVGDLDNLNTHPIQIGNRSTIETPTRKTRIEEEAEEIAGKRNKRQERNKSLRRFALRFGLPAVLVAGAIGVKVYDEINQEPAPASEQIPSIFDHSLAQVIIGNENLLEMPQEEINQQFPTAFEKLDDGKNTLQLQHILDISESTDPKAQLTLVKSFGGSSYAEREQYKYSGIFDTFVFKNVPGGTIVRAPVDGYVRATIWPPVAPNGADNQGVLIDFVAPNGSHYRIIIGGSTKQDFDDGTTNQVTGYVFKSLIKIPTAKVEDNKQALGSYGVPIRKGEPILQLITPKDGSPIEEVGFSIAVARKGKIGKPVDMDQPSIPTNVELFLTPDGKLISPE